MGLLSIVYSLFNLSSLPQDRQDSQDNIIQWKASRTGVSRHKTRQRQMGDPNPRATYWRLHVLLPEATSDTVPCLGAKCIKAYRTQPGGYDLWYHLSSQQRASYFKDVLKTDYIIPVTSEDFQDQDIVSSDCAYVYHQTTPVSMPEDSTTIPVIHPDNTIPPYQPASVLNPQTDDVSVLDEDKTVCLPSKKEQRILDWVRGYNKRKADNDIKLDALIKKRKVIDMLIEDAIETKTQQDNFNGFQELIADTDDED